MYRVAGLAVAAIGVTFAAAPEAGAVEQVRAGVLAHNICVTNCKNADKEDGPTIDVQVNFKSPGFLRFAGSPQPYVSASPNVSGDTSFAAAGLEWRWEFADGWALAPSFGYAVHNGETRNEFANGDPRATAFAARHVLYGSRDLFRNAVGLQREFGPKWSGEAYFVHYSHGQILGNGRNQGTDQAGVRLGYKFGD